MGLNSHLTWHDRLRIERLYNNGMKAPSIARVLRVHTNTIYRELQRGEYYALTSELEEVRRYSPEIAQAKADELKAKHGAPLKIGNDHALAREIERLIVEEHKSPEVAIADILKGDTQYSVTICPKTVRNYIEKDVFLRLSMKDLPNGGKKKQKKRKIIRAARPSAGKSIEERPREIDLRIEFGHWEMDCVCGKQRTKPTLLVLTERKTRNEIIFKMPDHTAASVVACIDRLERRYGRRFIKVFKSITVDNGSEFMDVEGIENSCLRSSKRTTVYYCHPYCASERGSNENQNRMIRRFLPKGMDFRRVTSGYIRRLEAWMNNYRRRILHWATPKELFDRELLLL